MKEWRQQEVDELLNDATNLMNEFEKSKLIAEIHATNLTHAIIGGYNAKTYSDALELAELPRATSIKGVWRWWFKSLLAGAMWSVRGKIEEKEINEIRRITQKVLGSPDGVSNYRLYVVVKPKEKITPPPANQIERLRKVIKYGRQRLKQELRIKEDKAKLLKKLVSDLVPPRIRLLALADETSKEVAERLSFYEPKYLNITISIYEVGKNYKANFKEKERRAVVGSLLIALLFQGLGAIVRRGFGSLEITEIESNQQFKGELAEIENYVSSIYNAKSKSGVEKSLKSLISTILDDFRALLNEREKSLTTGIPPFPVVSDDDRIFRWRTLIKEISVTENERGFLQEFLKVEDVNSMKLLSIIGKATLKASWKVKRGKKVSSNGKIHTWILGLPRGQELEDLKTGYWLKKDGEEELGRRASAISFNVLKRLDAKNWLILYYGFLSQDWPIDHLWHYSAGRKPIKVTSIMNNQNLDIKKIFDEAFRAVEKCLKNI